MSWSIDSTINEGYPYILGFTAIGIKTGWTNNESISLPASIWRINADVNEGYPYTWNMIAVESGYIYSPDVIIGSDTKYKEWEKEHGGGGGGDRPKPDPDKNPVLPGQPGFNLADRGCQVYIMPTSSFDQMWDDIYNGSKNKWKDLLEGLALFGSNPLNAILAYRWVPFSLNPSSNQSRVILGSTAVGPVGHEYPVIKGNNAFYSSQGSFWYGADKNFINSKHCKCRLWLPFYGFAELPMSQVLSKELEIEFHYNVPDDLGVWIISFGNVIYDYYECVPYIDIPITGDNSSQIAIAKQQQAISTALTIAGTAATLATAGMAAAPAIGYLGTMAADSGGALLSSLAWTMAEAPLEVGKVGLGVASGLSALRGAAQSTANVINGTTQTANRIGTLATNVPTKAGASATTFLNLPMKPYIQFYTNIDMETANIAQYKRTVGIACEQWSTIAAMPDNSLLSISNPVFDTSGMTENEVNALITALSGFVK